MVRIPGSWSSFDDIEVSLTLDELMLLYSTIQDSIQEDRRFAASLQGVDLGDGGQSEEASSFEDVKRRAAAKAAGKTEDELEFAGMGFGFVEVTE